MARWWRPQLKPCLMAYGAILLIACSGLNYQLADPDEGRYAEIPREMIERGDWITPTLNYVPYFEKPPLLYWLIAGSLVTFGEHEWAIRLIPTIFGLCGLLIGYHLARQTLGTAAARWAPALLFTTPLYFVMARIPLTDTVFAVFLAGALAAWWDWEQSEGQAWWMTLITGAFLGMAILSKGPVALVLFIGSVGVYLLVARRLSWRSLASGAVALLVGCAIAAPWFIAVQARNPQFNHYFFVVQHFNRFSGQNFSEHARPFWYFLPMAVLGLGPWASIWPWAIRCWPEAWRRSTPGQRQSWLYLAAWAAFPLFFFSLSSCKLVTYILPVQWPLAVLTAYGAHRLLRPTGVARGLRLTLVGLATVIVLVLIWGVIKLTSRDPNLSSSPVTLLSLALWIASWVAAAAGLIVAPRLRPVQWRWGVLVLSVALLWGSLLPPYGDLVKGMHLSGLLPATLHAAGPGRDCTLATYGVYSPSLGFYTHKRIVLIDAVGELKLGLKEPDADLWFREGEETIDDLARCGPLAVLTHVRKAPELARAHGLTVYRANADRALLLNPSALTLLSIPHSGGQSDAP